MNKILISSWIKICIALLLVGAGTYAFFNDSEKSINNVITTGIIDLEVNGENPLVGSIITINDLKPCNWYYKNITLHLTGDSNPAKAWMHIFNVTDFCNKSTICVSPDATAWVDSGKPNEEHCNENKLHIRVKKSCCGTELRRTYLYFNSISPSNGDPIKLRINAEFKNPKGSGVTIGVYKTSWDGSCINWNNAPAIGDLIDTQYVNSDGYVYFNITSAVTGGELSLALKMVNESLSNCQNEKHVDFTEPCITQYINKPGISNHIEIDLKLTNTSNNKTFIIIDENQHKTLRDLECHWINLTDLQWSTSGYYAIWANSTTASDTFWSTGGHHEINGIVHSNNEIRVTGSHTAFYGGTHYVTDITITGSHHIFNPSPEQVSIQPLLITYNIEDYKPGGTIAEQANAEGKYHYISGDFHVSGSHTTLDGLYYVTGDVHLSGSSLSGNYTIVAEGTIKTSGSHYNSEAYAGNLLYFSNNTDNRAIDISGSHYDIKGIYYAPKGGIEITGSHHTMYGAIIGNTVKIAGSHFYLTGSIPKTTEQVYLSHLQPCTNYILQLSIHLQNVGNEYQGCYCTFSVEFYAQQIDGSGPNVGG